MGLITSTSALVYSDRSKGGIGNRVDCRIEQKKNSLKTGAKQALVTAGGAASLVGTVAFAKTNTGKKVFEKLAVWTKNVMQKAAKTKTGGNVLSTISKVGKKVLNVMQTNPKLAVGLAVATTAIGLGTALVNRMIQRQHDFKAGQIDQKYTDIATVSKDASSCLA